MTEFSVLSELYVLNSAPSAACDTGGVVTLDPCGHLCSLDGVQVTVPTPLTQGKGGHAVISTLSHLCFTTVHCHLLETNKNV